MRSTSLLTIAGTEAGNKNPSTGAVRQFTLREAAQYVRPNFYCRVSGQLINVPVEAFLPPAMSLQPKRPFLLCTANIHIPTGGQLSSHFRNGHRNRLMELEKQPVALPRLLTYVQNGIRAFGSAPHPAH